MAAFLVDTNVLVYAYDSRDLAKQARASAIVRRLARSRQGALSAQVLGEFYWTATRRLLPPLTPPDAERHLTNYARTWPILDVISVTVLEAVRAVQRYQLAYWDALIWATAKLNAVANVLTEDLPGTNVIEGVRFANPLDRAFDLARLD